MPEQPATAARKAALYCIEKPYYGRDQHLARGWLIVLDAIDQGRDPEAALNEFAAAFVANSNNGVPRRCSMASDTAAPRYYECECCELSLCERKSPGIGYYCDTCMNHWCWAQDVGRPNARHATFAECDAEIKADHARLTAVSHA